MIRTPSVPNGERELGHPGPELPFAGAGVSPAMSEGDWVTVLLT